MLKTELLLGDVIVYLYKKKSMLQTKEKREIKG